MRSRTSTPSIIAIATLISTYISLVTAHTVITYPGYRGNNLIRTGTPYETNGLGEGPNGTFPYGMQWMYPCKSLLVSFTIPQTISDREQPTGGGMPTSTNRTFWPITGGAVAIQPGWDVGHPTAFFYINMGFGSVPPNMSNPMVPPFQIQGPQKTEYPGTFCLPQVPLPVNAPNASVKIGDNATIQVIETGLHGGALYNVRLPTITRKYMNRKTDNLNFSAWISLSPTHMTWQKSIPQTVSTHQISAFKWSSQPPVSPRQHRLCRQRYTLLLHLCC